jgi:hypothetical protein
MCAQEPNREWSGVLFYSTEGAFGEEGFSIVAEEFYLMDVGTSAFTGYDYDADFVAFMMNNPRLLKLKKGHIHSHHTMSVFFSDTDTDEIRDNSEFHNYYFSLIVNNRNDMTAKVAFRGRQNTKSVTNYSYKGDNGIEKSGAYESVIENTVCYVYNTIIDKSFHNDLSGKYYMIKSKPILPPVTKVTGPIGAPYKKKEELPFEKYSKDFDWETDVWGDEATTEDILYGKDSKPKDITCLSFISKVMVGDLLNEEDTLTIIKRFSAMNQSELEAAQGRIEKRLMTYYIDCFPEDQHLVLFEEVMSECQSLVELYDDKYDRVVTMLWEVFNVEIKD